MTDTAPFAAVSASAVHTFIRDNPGKSTTEIAAHFGCKREAVIPMLYAMRNKGAATYVWPAGERDGTGHWSGVKGVRWNGEPDVAPVATVAKKKKAKPIEFTDADLDEVEGKLRKFGATYEAEIGVALDKAPPYVRAALIELEKRGRVRLTTRNKSRAATPFVVRSIADEARAFAKTRWESEGVSASFGSADLAEHFAGIGAPEIDSSRASMALFDLVRQGYITKESKGPGHASKYVYLSPDAIETPTDAADLIQSLEKPTSKGFTSIGEERARQNAPGTAWVIEYADGTMMPFLGTKPTTDLYEAFKATDFEHAERMQRISGGTARAVFRVEGDAWAFVDAPKHVAIDLPEMTEPAPSAKPLATLFVCLWLIAFAMLIVYVTTHPTPVASVDVGEPSFSAFPLDTTPVDAGEISEGE